MPVDAVAFNSLDWALLVLAGISTLRGLMRGFVRTLFSSVGLLGGILLACWFYHPLAHALIGWIPNTTAAEVTAFLLIALVLVLLNLLADLLYGLLDPRIAHGRG